MTQNLTEKVRYRATLVLTNSAQIRFTRRDLAGCFYPPQVVKKADRIFDVLIINGTHTHEENPLYLKELWKIIPKAYIYNGMVKKLTINSYNWTMIQRKLCKDFKLKAFRITLITHNKEKIVTQIEVISDTDDFAVHSATIRTIISAIKDARNLTFRLESCVREVEDNKCPVVDYSANLKELTSKVLQ